MGGSLERRDRSRSLARFRQLIEICRKVGILIQAAGAAADYLSFRVAGMVKETEAGPFHG